MYGKRSSWSAKGCHMKRKKPGQSSSSAQIRKPNVDKFNRNPWVKVPESGSAPLPPCPSCRTDNASLLKLKGGADRDGQERHFLMPKRVTTTGAWNVRTLNTGRGTSLLMHELSPFRWDVTRVTETHWTGTQEYAVSRCEIINSCGGENTQPV